METMTKSEVQLRKDELLERINEGEVFIHPTDTIYGLGCNASDDRAVKKIRKIKDRKDNPFSIWVPNKNWIRQHCEVDAEAEKWLSKLPGPFTLIMRLKNKNSVAPSVHLANHTVGVRLPNHWFHHVVERLGSPIVTTSANRTGKMFMSSIENLDPEVKNGVRFIIYEGEKKGNPSSIVHLDGSDRVVARKK